MLKLYTSSYNTTPAQPFSLFGQTSWLTRRRRRQYDSRWFEWRPPAASKRDRAGLMFFFQISSVSICMTHHPQQPRPPTPLVFLETRIQGCQIQEQDWGKFDPLLWDTNRTEGVGCFSRCTTLYHQTNVHRMVRAFLRCTQVIVTPGLGDAKQGRSLLHAAMAVRPPTPKTR